MVKKFVENEMNVKVAKKKTKIRKAVFKNIKKRTKSRNVRKGKIFLARISGMSDATPKAAASSESKVRMKILSPTPKGPDRKF